MFKRPPFLNSNDSVALIATAKSFAKSELKPAITILKSWGLKVIEGPSIYKTHHQFAGTDEERSSDLQWALNDKTIKAIFCIRGGYGTARIIDNIDFKTFAKNPKWVIGFSDVTTLHASIQLQKIQSIHGVMPILFQTKEYATSIKKLKAAVFGEEITYKIPTHALNRTGEINAILVGGNLSIVCSLIGTTNAINTKDKILFIEDVGENLYRIDRMINQLKRAGMLASLKGLIVGHFTAMEDNKVKFGKTAYEIIAEAVKGYTYPVCYDFPAGHEPENMPIFFGATISLSCQKKYATLKFLS